MRLAIVIAGLLLATIPAAAQEDGRFLFDFNPGHEAERTTLANRVVAEAEHVADAAVILCSTAGGERGADHRDETTALLERAGAARQRVLDAGYCTPEITGRSNRALGENRVWLALSTAAFLENYRRERLGL